MPADTSNAQPEEYYKVKLNKVVKLGEGDTATVLHPMSENIVKGKILSQLGDALESYEPHKPV